MARPLPLPLPLRSGALFPIGLASAIAIAAAAGGCSDDGKKGGGGGTNAGGGGSTGKGGSNANGGAGGEMPGCTKNKDCTESEDECLVAVCDTKKGKCDFDFVAEDTPLEVQDKGDCVLAVCDGNGAETTIPAEDPFDDDNDCTANTCDAGTPKNPFLDPGEACNSDGGSVCDGAGKCVECNVLDDCVTGVCNPSHHCTTSIVVTPASPVLNGNPGGTNGAVSLPDAVVGTVFSATIDIIGGEAPYTINVVGSAPSGLTITQDATHVYVNGTANAASRTEFTVQVDDNGGGQQDVLYNVRAIAAAPQITTTSPMTAAKALAAYSVTLAGSGGTGTRSYSTSSTLPAPLTLSSAGVVSGTPSAAAAEAGTNGTYTITFQVADQLTDRVTNAADPRTATKALSLYVKTSYRGNIISKFSPSCTGCHGTGFTPNFFGAGTMISNATAAGLVGVASQAAGSCVSRTYVVNGNANNSLIIGKIDVNPAVCGNCMPDGAACQVLASGTRALVRRWIDSDIVGTD